MTEPTTPGNSYEPPLVPPTYSGPSMPDIADLVEGSRGRKDAPSGGSGTAGGGGTQPPLQVTAVTAAQ